MNIFIFFGAAFLLNVYTVWITIMEFDKKIKRMTCAEWERDKYFDLMINDLGMSYREAKEEYDKLETYDHLITVNKVMTKALKKEPTYV
jgi:hypothetical protein